MNIVTFAVALLVAGPFAPIDQIEVQAEVHPLVWQLLDETDVRAKVWIFFHDKSAACDESAAELSPRAIERRRLRRSVSGTFDVRDLPVDRSNIAAVRAAGAQIENESRWLNAISANATADQVRAIAAFDFVDRIEPVRRGRPVHATPGRAVPITELPEGGFFGLAENQLDMIGLTDLHDAGFTGEGVVIGVIDTGFHRTHEAFNEPGHEIVVIAEHDFVDDDDDTSFEKDDPVVQGPFGPAYQHAHGTYILGTIAAYKPNVFIGGAPDASFILAKTEDITQEVPAEEDDFVAGLEFIERMGADISSSSLAYIDFYDYFDMDGLTATSTIGMNVATENGLICVTAAGNGGIDSDLPTIQAPGDAFDVITAGAVNPDGTLADFSSFGPTSDGRTKPEVMAQGNLVATVDALSDAVYVTQDGTSLSTPLVASAVALLLQQHPTWGIEEMRTALFETASIYVATGAPDPFSHEGYGIIDAVAASKMSFGSPSDLDGDGDTDFNDLLTLLDAWGDCDPKESCLADLDASGGVGFGDLLILLANWS